MNENTIVFYVHKFKSKNWNKIQSYFMCMNFNLNSLNFNVGKDPINTVELSNLLLKIFHFFIPAFQSTFQLKLRADCGRHQTPGKLHSLDRDDSLIDITLLTFFYFYICFSINWNTKLELSPQTPFSRPRWRCNWCIFNRSQYR